MQLFMTVGLGFSVNLAGQLTQPLKLNLCTEDICSDPTYFKSFLSTYTLQSVSSEIIYIVLENSLLIIGGF